jgi:hypothetical protein
MHRQRAWPHACAAIMTSPQCLNQHARSASRTSEGMLRAGETMSRAKQEPTASCRSPACVAWSITHCPGLLADSMRESTHASPAGAYSYSTACLHRCAGLPLQASRTSSVCPGCRATHSPVLVSCTAMASHLPRGRSRHSRQKLSFEAVTASMPKTCHCRLSLPPVPRTITRESHYRKHRCQNASRPTASCLSVMLQ